jgi:hypothetical protein
MGRGARFHRWERGHADWRLQAIRNYRFRHDAHGREVPFHDVQNSRDHHDAHGSDHSRDKDHH